MISGVRRVLRPSRSGASGSGVPTADMMLRQHLRDSRHSYMVDSDEDEDEDAGQGGGDGGDGGYTGAGHDTPVDYSPPTRFPPGMPTEFVLYPDIPGMDRGESSSNPTRVHQSAHDPVVTQSQDTLYYPHETGGQTQYDPQDQATQHDIGLDMLESLVRADISPLPNSGSLFPNPSVPASGLFTYPPPDSFFPDPSDPQFSYPRQSYETPPAYAQGASSSRQHILPQGRRSVDSHHHSFSPLQMQDLTEESETEPDARLPRVRSRRGRGNRGLPPQQPQDHRRDQSLYGRVYRGPRPCGTDPGHRHGR